MRASTYLCTAISLSISILAGSGQILHQNRREDADDAIKLALPETIVLVGLSAQDADDGPLWKGQLIVRLSCVVVQGLCKGHCNRDVKVEDLTRHNWVSVLTQSKNISHRWSLH